MPKDIIELTEFFNRTVRIDLASYHSFRLQSYEKILNYTIVDYHYYF